MFETSFCCTFSVWFLYKNFLYLILHQGIYKVSMSYLFSFSGYQTKCVIEFLFRQLMTSWTLRFIFNHPPKQWPTGRKKGKDRYTKIWISQERNELFRWNKKHFHRFWRAIIWWKIKIWWKIADTSFKKGKFRITLIIFGWLYLKMGMGL